MRLTTITLLYKKGREYWGDIVDTKLCIKKNDQVLYFSSDSVQLNLSEDNVKFFILSSDYGAILFLENNLITKKQEYLIIDMVEEKCYNMGYFQGKKSLELIKSFDSISRRDIVQKLAFEKVSSGTPKKDVFRKNVFEILGVNRWKKKEITL